ncbi:LOW QUALITY PROTEIN: TNFAIP3-interacting protein 3 [Choloepus didactylus]|uniref:LOW QUALITY PROTEIN: TNFAIP3-interacting protein 3 n=1 Tax=Choloepus didactylus TaxID=27675 RepID=UPI00189D32B6|nr:LOW QUALITY PROTEIN: TNFAIP3-interacting protein 3 [Choloepus didactylus]
MSGAEGSTEHTEESTEHPECVQSSRKKNFTNSLEHKIRCLEKQRKELLEVNQKWDHQFRTMKELYERKVAELKMKLEASERFLSLLEKERHPCQRESERQRDLPPDLMQREEKKKENLNEELHELKKENKLLKEKNAVVNRKKEHYECEIKRLNKALQDALKMECSPFSKDCLGKSEMKCSHEEMRTQMEVLKHQVQIYEEDFKKERSDRERLNQEKEELQQINQTSQSQLNRLNSQIKACQMEKEKLEKQLKQMHFPTCNCPWFTIFGIHGYQQVLGLCRITRSIHQTISGMLLTSFRQMCSIRQMVSLLKGKSISRRMYQQRSITGRQRAWQRALFFYFYCGWFLPQLFIIYSIICAWKCFPLARIEEKTSDS